MRRAIEESRAGSEGLEMQQMGECSVKYEQRLKEVRKLAMKISGGKFKKRENQCKALRWKCAWYLEE